ncbi:hypothetical protein VTJ49DRAFT_4301 [Mycothermus thermophilus]|uniref:Uncharacterized protein n=1 Tax=Humicola insolens TaxID=85995 RepID=A0ABR3V5P3_HUMIN
MGRYRKTQSRQRGGHFQGGSQAARTERMGNPSHGLVQWSQSGSQTVSHIPQGRSQRATFENTHQASASRTSKKRKRQQPSSGPPAASQQSVLGPNVTTSTNVNQAEAAASHVPTTPTMAPAAPAPSGTAEAAPMRNEPDPRVNALLAQIRTVMNVSPPQEARTHIDTARAFLQGLAMGAGMVMPASSSAEATRRRIDRRSRSPSRHIHPRRSQSPRASWCVSDCGQHRHEQQAGCTHRERSPLGRPGQHRQGHQPKTANAARDAAVEGVGPRFGSISPQGTNGSVEWVRRPGF